MAVDRWSDGPADVDSGGCTFPNRKRFWLFLLRQKNTWDSRIRKRKSARQ